MAGKALPVFDRRVTVRTVVTEPGHYDEDDRFVPGAETVTDRRIGAALATVVPDAVYAGGTTDTAAAVAAATVSVVLIRYARGILDAIRANIAAARVFVDGVAMLVDQAGEAPEYGRHRVIRLAVSLTPP